MTELRTRILHITDVEDDLDKVEVVRQYIASKQGTSEAIDALFMTGDWIKAHPGYDKTADRLVEKLSDLPPSEELKKAVQDQLDYVEKLQKAGKKAADLTDEEKTEFEQLGLKVESAEQKWVTEHADKLHQPMLDEVTKAYQTLADAFGKITDLAPVFGIMGNHDLKLGYDILKDKVIFVEKVNRANFKGKNDLEFSLKGDINTFEVPGFYVLLQSVLEKYFIPYESGESFDEASAAVNNLQAKLSPARDKRLETLAKGAEPEVSLEEIKKDERNLEYLIRRRSEIFDYQKAQRERLGNPEEAVDIYLTHKLPSVKKTRTEVKGPLGEITARYSAHATSILGGHFDDGQIGYRTIEDFLKQELTEKITIDGVEVPVFYLDEKEPWELNPGTNHFFVTEYDANKKVEQVVIHEFYYEEAA